MFEFAKIQLVSYSVMREKLLDEILLKLFLVFLETLFLFRKEMKY